MEIHTGRADEGGCREGGHRDSALLVGPQVGECPAYEGHGGGEGDAVDGAADDERCDVLRYGAGNDEDDGEEESRSADPGQHGSDA